MKPHACLLAASLLVTGLVPTFARAGDIAPFIRNSEFQDIRISPRGDYLAATVPFEDRTALVILRRSDRRITGSFRMGRNTHVIGFEWVSPERVIIGMAEKIGMLDKPQATGDLYAINADGSQAGILVGQSVASEGPGTRLQSQKVEPVYAQLVDGLPADDRNVIVSVSPFTAEPFTRAERMDVLSGRRFRIASAPVARARFYTDNAGVVRFALGAGSDNFAKLYYRPADGTDWELVADEASGHDRQYPIGFSADNGTAYLQVERAKGPDAIVALDLASRERREVLKDGVGDPEHVIYRTGTRIPVGVAFANDKPRTEFFDEKSPEARLQRTLEASFAGQTVMVTSRSADGRLATVLVSSDRNPGEFYLLDTQSGQAAYLLGRRDWVDPERMAAKRPVEFDARDGVRLRGYLTLPAKGQAERLPMVVLPHGGPFGIRDDWEYDPEVQLLADAGYAVLQVNYRGSSGYGRAFYEAGARQWGRAMQDDLTDATRWAIAGGTADADRICIYGASYGGYAALMGAAKEPSLYRCAAGYVGVYDLPMMQADDSGDSRSLARWSREWVGERETLAEVSPNRMADRIRIPVFLAAGGEDEIAPIRHSRMMEQALAKAGVPVESLYYSTEGHGFYRPEHRAEFYTRLLAFLDRNIGAGRQAAGTTASK